MVDMDPQASLSTWIQAGEGPTVADVLSEDVSAADALQETCWEDLLVIPSDRKLDIWEQRKAGVIGTHAIWRRADDVFEFVMIDTPPAYSSLSVGACQAADVVIVPVEASVTAVDTLGDTIQMVQDLDKEWAVLVCRVDRRTSNDISIAPMLAEELGQNRVFRTVIHESVRMREAAAEREPPPEHSPRANSTVDYKAFTDELLRRYA